MGRCKPERGSTGAPERLRTVQDSVSSVPPKLVQCTKDGVCRLVHHQIWSMRVPSSHQTRCALAQTIVCHEPLRFSERFYVATYFRFGLEDHTGGLYLDMLFWLPRSRDLRFIQPENKNDRFYPRFIHFEIEVLPPGHSFWSWKPNPKPVPTVQKKSGWSEMLLSWFSRYRKWHHFAHEGNSGIPLYTAFYYVRKIGHRKIT